MRLESLSESGGGEDDDTLTTERTLRKFDHTIIKAQAEYGAVYNETAPVSNLPTEILCQIFEAGQDASRIHKGFKHPFVEVVISHVCRGWRSVALSLPPLWSTFRQYCICDQAYHQLENRLDVYMERSSSHLLDFYFHFGCSTRSRGLFKFILESTLPHVARWRRFFITSDDYDSILGLPDRPYRLEAPNLEYLSLGPAMLYPGTFLRDAPKLCYLRMETLCPSQCFPLLSNITVLRIEPHSYSDHSRSGSWNDFLEILALPSLSCLSIVGQHFSKPESQHSSNIIMQNLKHLRYGEENILFGHFFPFFSAPLLETLVLRNLNSPSLDLVDKEPFYMLHSLTVIHCPYLFPNLAAITPSVTHLTISDSSPPKFIIEFDKDGNNFWGKLKVLTGRIYEGGRTFSFFLEFARKMANPDLIMRTWAFIIKEWAQDRSKIEQLQALCVLEEIPLGNQEIPWPPGADVPVETDFFTMYYYRSK